MCVTLILCIAVAAAARISLVGKVTEAHSMSNPKILASTEQIPWPINIKPRFSPLKQPRNDIYIQFIYNSEYNMTKKQFIVFSHTSQSFSRSVDQKYLNNY